MQFCHLTNLVAATHWKQDKPLMNIKQAAGTVPNLVQERRMSRRACDVTKEVMQRRYWHMKHNAVNIMNYNETAAEDGRTLDGAILWRNFPAFCDI